MIAIRELFAEDLQIIEIRDDDEWGMDRNEGIGGSEAGSVLGLNKYHTALDLLEEKVKRTSLRGFTEAQELRMDCGHALEALTLKTFAAKELKLPYTTSFEDLDHMDALGHLSKHLFINPRHPFAFAHVDGLYRLKGELGIVDAKASFRSPWIEVPEYYVAQLAHYNAVLGGRVGYIAAMFLDHPYPEPREYRFDFTAEQLKLVMKAEALFWKYVIRMRAAIAAATPAAMQNFPSEDELFWLKSTLAQMGEEFMAGVRSGADDDETEVERITLSDEDMDLLIRYERLKKEAGEMYAEKEAIAEYLKKRFKAPNAVLLSSEGIELAKKSTISRKSLDREAMVEAGVPVEEFYTKKPEVRLNTKKPLSQMAEKPESVPGAKATAGEIPLIAKRPTVDDLADQDLPLGDLFSSDLLANLPAPQGSRR